MYLWLLLRNILHFFLFLRCKICMHDFFLFKGFKEKKIKNQIIAMLDQRFSIETDIK